MRLADKITPISNCVKRILIKNDIHVEKIHVIPVFFNQRLYQNLNKDIFKQLIPSFPQKKTILFVGRLKVEKGIELFIKAAQFLINKGVDANFVVVGSGPLLYPMQDLVQTLKLSKNIFFTGNLSYKLMPSVYASADMVVAPIIREEALGRVLIESMAANSPVVATRTCGILDTVVDRVNGLLVQPNIKEISEAILMLLNEDSLRKELGRRGQQYVTKMFSESNVVPKMIKIYKEIRDKTNNVSDF